MSRVARFTLLAVLLRVALLVALPAGLIGLKPEAALGQTPPPGMVLVSCPVSPSPWEAPGLAGHPGWDLNLDPSSALSIARGVPEQCIAYPADSEQTYKRIIGLRVYIPRYGTDPGSQTGALAQAVAIRDNNSGTWSTTEAEFWGLQNWRDWVSDSGRWLYSVRGGLVTDRNDPRYCDVVSQTEWRRWAVLVQERDLVGCLERIWARGGILGMPATATPVVVSNATNPAQTALPTPTSIASRPANAALAPTPSTEDRLTLLERQQAEMLQLLRQMQATPTPGAQP